MTQKACQNFILISISFEYFYSGTFAIAVCNWQQTNKSLRIEKKTAFAHRWQFLQM